MLKEKSLLVKRVATGLFFDTLYIDDNEICVISSIVAPNAPVHIRNNIGLCCDSNYDYNNMFVAGIARYVVDENMTIIAKLQWEGNNQYVLFTERNEIFIVDNVEQVDFFQDKSLVCSMQNIDKSMLNNVKKQEDYYIIDRVKEIKLYRLIDYNLLSLLSAYPMLKFAPNLPFDD